MYHNRKNQYPVQEEELADVFGTIAGDLGWNNFLALLILALTLGPASMKAIDVHLAETNKEAGSEPSPACTVSIDANGNLAVDGEPVASTEALRQRLAARARTTTESGDSACEKVIIAPDRKTPWQGIVAVRDVVAEVTNKKECVLLAKGRKD